MERVTRIFTFDSGHRVMNEKFKCFNLHGHTYKIEATWMFESNEAIGYAIDFKEIKRVFGQFIDDYLDHGFISNPRDKNYIDVCEEENSKIWLMSLNGMRYCNPTAENIAKEIFLIADLLVNDFRTGLIVENIRLWETPNCYVDADRSSCTQAEKQEFLQARETQIMNYKKLKGDLNYDDRAK